MQCKSVTALPAGETWAFEIKLDGYRCVAVKHGSEVTPFSRHKKLLNRRFPGVVEAVTSRSRAASCSTENWSLWIRKAGLYFSSCKTGFRSRFRSIVTHSIY